MSQIICIRKVIFLFLPRLIIYLVILRLLLWCVCTQDIYVIMFRSKISGPSCPRSPFSQSLNIGERRVLGRVGTFILLLHTIRQCFVICTCIRGAFQKYAEKSHKFTSAASILLKFMDIIP